MNDTNLIWPSRLHHFALTSEDPKRLADWYESALGFTSVEPHEGGSLLRGAERNLIILPGQKGGVEYAAYACTDETQLDRLRAHMQASGAATDPFESPLFTDDAFSTTDHDGNRIVFGLTGGRAGDHDDLPGRLQHIVFATEQLARQIEFYTDVVGFRKSDTVVDEEKAPTACFMRSDPEHHSLGLFRAAAARLDHFCFESTCWNDIRDWGDHFADLRIPIVWGAGRHGAGNNLFIFVEDPDGNKPEISAEIERMTFEQEPRVWPHEQRTLNLWGSAWMRS